MKQKKVILYCYGNYFNSTVWENGKSVKRLINTGVWSVNIEKIIRFCWWEIYLEFER